MFRVALWRCDLRFFLDKERGGYKTSLKFYTQPNCVSKWNGIARARRIKLNPKGPPRQAARTSGSKIIADRRKLDKRTDERSEAGDKEFKQCDAPSMTLVYPRTHHPFPHSMIPSLHLELLMSVLHCLLLMAILPLVHPEAHQ